MDLERAQRLFFRHFFRLLLFAIAVGEWACGAWLAAAAGAHLPGWTHVVGPLIVWLVNFSVMKLVRRHPMRWQHRGVRLYAAFAFTSVFGFAFLLFNTAAWKILAMLTQDVSLAAADRGLVATLPLTGYQWTSTAGLLGIGLLFLYGYTFGHQRLGITHLRLPLRHAGPALAGLRIAHISDIHIGGYMSPDLLREYVGRVNRLEADLIVITGDLLDHASAIASGFPVLAGLRARLGVFVILGNHDVAAGAEEVSDGLRRLTPFTLLRNQVATVEVGGCRLHIAGVDDLGRDWARGVRRHPGLQAIEADLCPGEPVILLSHRPDLFPQAAAAGVDLVLSGHTHGGQLSLPPIGGRRFTLARFITPYDRGLYADGDSFLYVNRGLGCTGQRIRLFTPREITVVEIEAEALGQAAATANAPFETKVTPRQAIPTREAC